MLPFSNGRRRKGVEWLQKSLLKELENFYKIYEENVKLSPTREKEQFNKKQKHLVWLFIRLWL